MKLIVNYDPINGEVVADGKVASYVRDMIATAKVFLKSIEYSVGTSLIVEEIRALIHEGTISHEDVVLKFKGEELNIDSQGYIDYWPRGFCDASDNILNRLLKTDDCL